MFEDLEVASAVQTPLEARAFRTASLGRDVEEGGERLAEWKVRGW